MAHLAKLDINGDPNIGLYGIATDEFCLVGKCLSKKHVKKIEEVLQVPVYQIKLYGTDLIGIFAVANSNSVLIPDIIFDSELKELKKLPIEFSTIKTEKTALNNNILCNNSVAFVSKHYSKKEVKTIKKALDVNVIKTKIAGNDLLGSSGIATEKGAIISPKAKKSEIKKIEKKLGFKVGLGSVNLGNGLVGSGIIANSKGFLVGKLTSGFEITRIDESLRLL